MKTLKIVLAMLAVTLLPMTVSAQLADEKLETVAAENNDDQCNRMAGCCHIFSGLYEWWDRRTDGGYYSFCSCTFKNGQGPFVHEWDKCYETPTALLDELL